MHAIKIGLIYTFVSRKKLRLIITKMNEIDLSNYTHVCKIWVRYADLDTLGHVNNKSYLSYLEEARIAFHAERFDFDVSTLDFSAVVGSINIRYIKPILISNKVTVYTRCSRVGNSSFDLESIITISDDAENPIIAAISTAGMVNIDTKTGKPTPISNEMRLKL